MTASGLVALSSSASDYDCGCCEGPISDRPQVNNLPHTIKVAGRQAALALVHIQLVHIHAAHTALAEICAAHPVAAAAHRFRAALGRTMC